MNKNNNGKFEASEVAAYIVKKMNSENKRLDHLKLQKLMYFIAIYWIKKFNVYPYKEATEMWKLGPVIRDLYSEYRSNGSSRITKPSNKLVRNENGFVFKEVEPACFTNAEQSIVDSVINNYGDRGSFELVDITHTHKPWKNKEDLIKSNAITTLEYTFDDLLQISLEMSDGT